MIHPRTVTSVFACLSIITTSFAHAFVAPKESKPSFKKTSLPSISERTIRITTSAKNNFVQNKSGEPSIYENIFKNSHNNSANQILTDEKSQAIRLMAGHLAAAAIPKSDRLKPDVYIKLAKDYIDQNPQVFLVSPNDLEVLTEAILISDSDQFIKFRVKRAGVLIEDAGIDFRFKYGQLVQVINQSFAEATVDTTEENSDLLNQAQKQMPDFKLQRRADTLRVTTTTSAQEKNAYVLVRVANFEASHHDGRQLGLQLETKSAKVFELRNRHYHASGKATIASHTRWFNDPIEMKPLTFAQILTSNRSVISDHNGLFQAHREAYPNIAGLTGTFVDLTLISGSPLIRQATWENEKWALRADRRYSGEAWADKDTAQAMVYQHTTNIIQEAKRFITTPWFNTPLVANVNLRSSCNAHWDGSTINFYSSSNDCANTGLIADVIYHEWGHGLDANTGGISDSAFSEGFGDIMSLIMTRSSALGIGFRLPDFEPVRELETDKVYPDDRGEVHDEGLIIASTFWDLFEELSIKYSADEAIEIIKNYAFKMIYTARTYLDVYDALLVIDDDDADLTNGSPNKCTLNKVFSQHGLARKDISCTLASIDNFHFDDSDGDAIAEPGETIKVKVILTNHSERPIKNLNGTLRLVSGEGIEVTSGHLSWDKITSGTTQQSRDHAIIKIADHATCGTPFTTSLRLTAGERSVMATQLFTIGRNIGTAESTEALGLPMDIKDNKTIKADLVVESDQWDEQTAIDQAHLAFNISHSYIGDLTVTLIDPDGKRMKIFNGRGSDNNVVFDKDISDLIKGKVGRGTWSILVKDGAFRDEGSLDYVKLTLTPAIYECH